MSDPNRMKCRWCSWTTLKVYTDGYGRVRSGRLNLVRHVEREHLAELERIEREMREVRP